MLALPVLPHSNVDANFIATRARAGLGSAFVLQAAEVIEVAAALVNVTPPNSQSPPMSPTVDSSLSDWLSALSSQRHADANVGTLSMHNSPVAWQGDVSVGRDAAKKPLVNPGVHLFAVHPESDRPLCQDEVAFVMISPSVAAPAAAVAVAGRLDIVGPSMSRLSGRKSFEALCPSINGRHHHHATPETQLGCALWHCATGDVSTHPTATDHSLLRGSAADGITAWNNATLEDVQSHLRGVHEQLLTSSNLVTAGGPALKNWLVASPLMNSAVVAKQVPGSNLSATPVLLFPHAFANELEAEAGRYTDKGLPAPADAERLLLQRNARLAFEMAACYDALNPTHSSSITRAIVDSMLRACAVAHHQWSDPAATTAAPFALRLLATVRDTLHTGLSVTPSFLRLYRGTGVAPLSFPVPDDNAQSMRDALFRTAVFAVSAGGGVVSSAESLAASTGYVAFAVPLLSEGRAAGAPATGDAAHLDDFLRRLVGCVRCLAASSLAEHDGTANIRSHLSTSVRKQHADPFAEEEALPTSALPTSVPVDSPSAGRMPAEDADDQSVDGALRNLCPFVRLTGEYAIQRPTRFSDAVLASGIVCVTMLPTGPRCIVTPWLMAVLAEVAEPRRGAATVPPLSAHVAGRLLRTMLDIVRQALSADVAAFANARNGEQVVSYSAGGPPKPLTADVTMLDLAPLYEAWILQVVKRVVQWLELVTALTSEITATGLFAFTTGDVGPASASHLVGSLLSCKVRPPPPNNGAGAASDVAPRHLSRCLAAMTELVAHGRAVFCLHDHSSGIALTATLSLPSASLTSVVASHSASSPMPTVSCRSLQHVLNANGEPICFAWTPQATLANRGLDTPHAYASAFVQYMAVAMPKIVTLCRSQVTASQPPAVAPHP